MMMMMTTWWWFHITAHLAASRVLSFPNNLSTEVVRDTTRTTEPVAADAEVVDQVAVVRQEPHSLGDENQHIKDGRRVRMFNPIVDKREQYI